MSHFPLSIDIIGRSSACGGQTRTGRGAPVQAVQPVAAPPRIDAGVDTQQERRAATERRRRQLPVLLDTRCAGERRGRLRPVSC